MEEKTTVAEETVETDSSKKFCTSCGAEIHAEAVICPSCGAGQGTETANEEKGIKKFITRFKTDKKLQAIAGGILATIVIVVIIAVCSYLTSFEHYIDLMRDEYPLANCSYVADGSEMNMDRTTKFTHLLFRSQACRITSRETQPHIYSGVGLRFRLLSFGPFHSLHQNNRKQTPHFCL